MSTHFAAIGTALARRKAALLASTKRPQASAALEPLAPRRDLGEAALGARHRVGAAVLSHRTFGGSDLSPLGKCVFHASSAHGPGRNEPTTVSSPCWSARSLTSLPTARSRIPSPNGLNTQTVSEPLLAGLRPLRMSGKLQRMNFLCPTICSARCSEVWARQT